jgi:mannose-6-phosphate isomerase
MLGPLRLRPILKERVWGGDRLARLAGKTVEPGSRIGESWELVHRPDEASLIADGPHEGESLADLIAERGGEIYGNGPGPAPNGRFPLLIKFIDAVEKLSIQVHPDDAYVRDHGLEDMGKTECWYMLDPPRDGIILGLKEGVTPDVLRGAIQEDRVEECLRYQPARSGDLVFCPAGTVHSITPPAALVEIQQNSDLTYRLYDWGRVGLDGKSRELHVEQALAVIKTAAKTDLTPEPKTLAVSPFLWQRLVDCDRFAVDLWRIDNRAARTEKPDAFEILICIAGAGIIETGESPELDIRLGDTVLVPACVRQYTLTPDPDMTLLHAVGKE